MKGYVANTDAEWHAFLLATAPHDEVNFWQPAGGRTFRAIAPGEPVFFRLKRPLSRIGGFGRLARYETLPIQLAWDCFGPDNGTPDFATMLARTRMYARKFGHHDVGPMHAIGCMMISDPVFFAPTDAIDQPSGWAGQIVSGKTYSLDHGEGRRIWEACLARIQPPALAVAARDEPRYGTPYLVAPRLGQGTFRASVTMAYDRACAVSQEHSLPVLDAAHIRPFADGGPHAVTNGLALRSDIHRLFDAGYVTVTPQHRFEVSRRLKDDFSNGRSYQAFHGQPIHLPSRTSDRPDPTLLCWHNDQRYNG